MPETDWKALADELAATLQEIAWDYSADTWSVDDRNRVEAILARWDAAQRDGSACATGDEP